MVIEATSMVGKLIIYFRFLEVEAIIYLTYNHFTGKQIYKKVISHLSKTIPVIACLKVICEEPSGVITAYKI